MRINLHPLRNLALGTDPGVLTSNGMSVTGGAVVSLATRENLCPNPSFETQTLPWKNVVGASEVSRSDEAAYDGDYALKVEATGINARVYLDHTAAMVPVPGRTYSASFWGRVESAGRLGRIALRFYNAGGTQIGGDVLSPSGSHEAGVWKRHSASGVAPANAAFMWVICYLDTGNNGTAGQISYVDAVQVEQSILPRPFHESSLVVPAYDPRLNDYRPGTQATRIYWPASADPGDGHDLTYDLTTTPIDPGSVLTHVRTDDPGSVGNDAIAYLSWLDSEAAEIDSATQSIELAETAAPLAVSMAAPDGAETLVVSLRREPGVETNLLYSASQVSPHPIERYRDERAQGWRLRDVEDYSAGAESIPAPHRRNTRVNVRQPGRRVRIVNAQEEVAVA